MRKKLHLVFLFVYLITTIPALAQEPTPTPTPTPPPSPEAIRQAADEGEADGKADGAREGDETGPRDGRERGERDGDRAGYERCRDVERDKAHDRGREEGMPVGEREGRREGDEKGRDEGERQGTDEGVRQGRADADQTALRDATAPGRQKGVAEADARAGELTREGRADGIKQGDADALSKAKSEDYARGREEVKREKYAEAVVNRDAFSQRGAQGVGATPPRAPRFLSRLSGGAGAFFMNASFNFDGPASAPQDENNFSVPRPEANPRYTYRREPRGYPAQVLTDAYVRAYRRSYDSAFAAAFYDRFDYTYREARVASYRAGCRRAQGESYEDERRRGYDEAYKESFERERERAYNAAFAAAKDIARNDAYKKTYKETYQGFYDEHFDEVRRDASEQRARQIYLAAHEQAYREKYAQVYPGYRDREHARGRADEEEDFRARPLRLLDAAAVETIPNGLYEPGEPLRLKLSLRNFAGAAIEARDIKIKITAATSAETKVLEPEAVPVKGLRPKSVTEIGDALGFAPGDDTDGSTVGVLVSVTYQGKPAGEQRVILDSRFVAGLDLAEEPVLAEGLARPLRVRLTNRSRVPTDPALKLSFALRTDSVEAAKADEQIGALGPGESRVVEFPLVARVPADAVQLPLTLTATTGEGRRVGLLASGREVKVSNEYRVSLSGNVGNLRNAGVTRIEYAVRNLSSGATHRALQLTVRAVGPGADNFAVLGFNPHYLAPLERGQVVQFVVPITSKSASAGGVLEFELHEQGRPVVIHRAKF